MTTRRCRIFLVRHGETDWNKLGKLQGQTDTELTLHGRQQAVEVGDYFTELIETDGVSFTVLVSSDLKRCMDTAKEVLRGVSRLKGSNVALIPDPRLRERHLGVIQGHTWEECQEKLPEVFQMVWGVRSGDDERPPEGESENDVKLRTKAALRDICRTLLQQSNSAMTCPCGVIVSHGGALYAMSHAFSREDDGSGTLSNCSVSVLEVQLPKLKDSDLELELAGTEDSWWERLGWYQVGLLCCSERYTQ